MSDVQFLRTTSGDELAVLARADYEDLLDGARAAEVLARLERGEEELLTLAETKTLLAAPTPLAFWRRKRGLTEAALAATLGVSTSDLADYESGRLEGTVGLLSATGGNASNHVRRRRAAAPVALRRNQAIQGCEATQLDSCAAHARIRA